MNSRFLIAITVSSAVHAGVFVVGAGTYDHYLEGLQDTQVTQTLTVSVAISQPRAPESTAGSQPLEEHHAPGGGVAAAPALQTKPEPRSGNPAEPASASTPTDGSGTRMPRDAARNEPPPESAKVDSGTEPEPRSGGRQPAQQPEHTSAPLRSTPGDDAAAGARNSAAERTYLSEFLAELSKHKHYPRSARLRQQQGKVVIALLLHRDGMISEVSVAENSRYPSLNRAALRSVKQMRRFKPFPETLDRTQWRLNIPFKYAINDHRFSYRE